MKTHHGVDATTPGELLDRWVARGLLSREQAESIRAEEGWAAESRHPAVGAPPNRRASLISEALGYLGGILIVVAASLIGTWYWSDIPSWARLGIPIMAAASLLLAGWAADRRPSAVTARLRAVLWLGSAAAVAFTWWVVAALVGVAVLLRELIILGVAAFGALTVLPASVLHFFPGELAAPLALLVAGALLVLAGLRATRQRSRWRKAGTGARAGSRPLAIAIAGGAAVTTTVVVLALGLAD